MFFLRRHLTFSIQQQQSTHIVVAAATKRFCSTSSSSLTIPQLKNLALGSIPPTGDWLKVSEVARSLPDDFFDNLPDDVAGLRGLLELCDPKTEAVVSFRNTHGALEVSRLPLFDAVEAGMKAPSIGSEKNIKRGLSSDPEDKSYSKVRIEDVLNAPAPPPQDATTAAFRADFILDNASRAAVAQAQQQQQRESVAAKERRMKKHEESVRLARQQAEERKRERQEKHRLENAPGPIKRMINQSGGGADQFEIERAQLRSLTSFPINIVEAALDHRRLELLEERKDHDDKNREKSSVKQPQEEDTESSVVTTIRKEDLTREEILRSVEDFLCWVEPVKQMIDLFHTTADPWNSLKELIAKEKEDIDDKNKNNNTNTNSNNSTSESIVELLQNYYVSILLPFQASHGSLDGESKFAEFKAQEYDLYRLARFLSTSFFCSVSSLLESDVQDILQAPILQIIASYPNHFEFIAEGKPVPDGDVVKPCSVDQIVKGAEEAELLVVKVGKKSTTKNGGGGADQDSAVAVEVNDNDEFDKSDAFGFVRYILPHEQFTTATKCSFAFRNATYEELQHAVAIVKKATRYSTPPADLSPEDLGILKFFPTGPRRQSVKQELRRALNLRNFPQGNVFFDRNVLAHYIFDTIPPEESIAFEVYKREFLGARARNVAPMYGNFPTQYPHLFHAFQDDRGEWFLQRADSQHLVKVKQAEEITEEECIMAIFAAKPKKIDPFRPFQASTATYKMTKLVQKACKVKFGGINGLIQRNPKRFTIVADVVGPGGGARGQYFYFNDEITPEVCERVGLKKRDDGTYEVLKNFSRSLEPGEIGHNNSNNTKSDDDEKTEETIKKDVSIDEVQKRLKQDAEEKKLEDSGENVWDHYAAKKQ